MSSERHQNTELQSSAVSAPSDGVLPFEALSHGHEPLVENLQALRGLPSVLVVGGTFDPFTRAHLEVPHHVAEILGVATVLYVPAKQNPLKDTSARASPEDRLAMIRESLYAESSSYVTSIELERAGNSFTVDTLREIRAAVGPSTALYLYLGSDCIHKLPDWKSLEEIRVLATIVPVSRGETAEECLAAVEGKLSEDIVAELRARFVEIPVPEVSATMARERLATGEVPWDLLPAAVGRYIDERHLYGAGGPS